MTLISEAERIRRLHELGVLDDPGNPLFKGFAEQALQLLPGASIGAITLVDSNRLQFKTIVGANIRDLPRDTSFCTHTVETSGVMVVEDTARDNRFVANPLVTSAPGIRFYAGIKLMNGVGALCVTGSRPRRVTDSEVAKLAKLARCVDIQMLAHGTLFNLGQTSRSA